MDFLRAEGGKNGVLERYLGSERGKEATKMEVGRRFWGRKSGFGGGKRV